MNDRDIEDTRQPKDSIEAQFCEYCGQEMEYERWGDWMKHYFKCVNQFCPDKFTFGRGTAAYDMANRLVEVEQELRDTKSDLKYANARITNLNTRITNLQAEIEDDREVIIKLEKLTQSQQGE